MACQVNRYGLRLALTYTAAGIAIFAIALLLASIAI